MSVPHARKPAHEVDTAGGAYVRRWMPFAGRQVGPGDVLTEAEVRSIPRANLDALINTGRLELFRASGAGASFGGERFMLHLGAGRYHVVEGRRLTDEFVTREEAEAIVAGQTTHTAGEPDEGDAAEHMEA